MKSPEATAPSLPAPEQTPVPAEHVDDMSLSKFNDRLDVFIANRNTKIIDAHLATLNPEEMYFGGDRNADNDIADWAGNRLLSKDTRGDIDLEMKDYPELIQRKLRNKFRKGAQAGDPKATLIFNALSDSIRQIDTASGRQPGERPVTDPEEAARWMDAKLLTLAKPGELEAAINGYPSFSKRLLENRLREAAANGDARAIKILGPWHTGQEDAIALAQFNERVDTFIGDPSRTQFDPIVERIQKLAESTGPSEDYLEAVRIEKQKALDAKNELIKKRAKRVARLKTQDAIQTRFRKITRS